jgi:hypothetical protein
VDAEMKNANQSWGSLQKLAKNRQRWKNFVAAPHARGRNGQLVSKSLNETFDILFLKKITMTITLLQFINHISIKVRLLTYTKPQRGFQDFHEFRYEFQISISKN